MPAVGVPQQQQPMEATGPGAITSQQPGAEPQPQSSQPEPEMALRGGFVEECSCCCCSEECACC